jgi:hypothetical protein
MRTEAIAQKIIEQLPTSLAAQQNKPNPNMTIEQKLESENLQIVIHVKGGYVVSVLSSTNPDIDVHVLDEDLDFHDDEDRDCKTQWDIAVKTLKYEVLNGAGSI